MKILITGGAGYIGSHTCKALTHAGNEVVVYDNLSTGHRDYARFADFVHGDIRDTQSLRKALRDFSPDGVIHFAACAYVGESVVNPGKYFNNNVCGTLSLLESMRDEGITTIVVSSTCAVYGSPISFPISESCPTHPINPYGATKLFIERMLQDFSKAHGLKWISLRYFNAAGCSADGDIGELHEPETHIIPRVILAALRKIPYIEIYGNDYPTPDGTCIRDYIHVEDLANAHISAILHLLHGGDSMVLNLGTESGYSVLDIINGVEKISGNSIPIKYVPRRPGDPPILVADTSLAKAVLTWEPQKNLNDMLSDAWKFYNILN